MVLMSEVIPRERFRHELMSEEGLTFGFGGNIFIIGKEIGINYTYQEFGGLEGYVQYFEFIFNL